MLDSILFKNSKQYNQVIFTQTHLLIIIIIIIIIIGNESNFCMLIEFHSSKRKMTYNENRTLLTSNMQRVIWKIHVCSSTDNQAQDSYSMITMIELYHSRTH